MVNLNLPVMYAYLEMLCLRIFMILFSENSFYYCVLSLLGHPTDLDAHYYAVLVKICLHFIIAVATLYFLCSQTLDF